MCTVLHVLVGIKKADRLWNGTMLQLRGSRRWIVIFQAGECDGVQTSNLPQM